MCQSFTFTEITLHVLFVMVLINCFECRNIFLSEILHYKIEKGFRKKNFFTLLVQLRTSAKIFRYAEQGSSTRWVLPPQTPPKILSAPVIQTLAFCLKSPVLPDQKERNQYCPREAC